MHEERKGKERKTDRMELKKTVCPSVRPSVRPSGFLPAFLLSRSPCVLRKGHYGQILEICPDIVTAAPLPSFYPSSANVEQYQNLPLQLNVHI